MAKASRRKVFLTMLAMRRVAMLYDVKPMAYSNISLVYKINCMYSR